MSKDQFLSVKVGQVMTKKVVSIDTSMTAIEVARLIAEQKVEGFPVVEKGEPTGIVTGWDLLTCSPDHSVLEAAKLMAKYGIKRIPVVKDNKVIGILTPYDIIMYRRILDYADFSH